MYVIKNITKAILMIDQVPIEPDEQLAVAHLSNAMQDAADAGALQIKSDETTLEERKADTRAIEEGIEAMRKITGD